jgi:hypothetical protein
LNEMISRGRTYQNDGICPLGTRGWTHFVEFVVLVLVADTHTGYAVYRVGGYWRWSSMSRTLGGEEHWKGSELAALVVVAVLDTPNISCMVPTSGIHAWRTSTWCTQRSHSRAAAQSLKLHRLRFIKLITQLSSSSNYTHACCQPRHCL